jgi:release factor glutamine methyltransferase
MTFRELLLRAQKRLETHETPYLDALILLAHAAGVGKERILASLPETVPEITAAFFDELLVRRLRGEPVAYIRNRKEFWGHDFYVDARVLIPRPDTEILVEEALGLLAERKGKLRVHDACTGSGCIAVALKLESPELEVSVSDISSPALEVAKFNSSSLLGAPLPALVSDLLRGVPGSFDLITCNPPYVEHEYVQNLLAGGWPEPELALDGGDDGYDLMPRLLQEALDRLNENGYLMVEASPRLVPRIVSDMQEAGFSGVRSVEDLSGRQRVALGRRQ